MDTSTWRILADPLVGPTGPGVLDGLTVAVKDLFAVAGQVTGAGNPTWLAEQDRHDRHAAAVESLLGAGASVAGIARTDEFAYSLAGQNAHYGTPPNPAAPGAVSGGSTSGPAAAVALGQVDIGLGTDTAGSIRVPASYQGLVGLRPTHGAVAAEGMQPLAPSFDTVAWLAREPRTAARVADVLLAHLPGRAVARRTIVLPALDAGVAPDIVAAASDVRQRLVAHGVLAAAEAVDLDPAAPAAWVTAFRAVQAHEAWREYGGWIDTHPGALGADIAGRFAVGKALTEDAACAARETVAAAGGLLRDLLDDAVLVIPTTAGGAPFPDGGGAVEDERAATLRLTHLASAAGTPAVSVPLLRTADGRPAGLCFVGAPGTDRALLGLAESAVAAMTGA
ncbi:amidase family protein [Pseudonocardia xinjiangensis]|uniref:amidase family protein n=1 Tax=Pseudonocardia xinjiangensis TaxID=75289 RepID=UPI003D8E55CB